MCDDDPMRHRRVTRSRGRAEEARAARLLRVGARALQEVSPGAGTQCPRLWGSPFLEFRGQGTAAPGAGRGCGDIDLASGGGTGARVGSSGEACGDVVMQVPSLPTPPALLAGPLSSFSQATSGVYIKQKL